MVLIILAFIAFNTGGNSSSSSYEVSSEEDDNTSVADFSGSNFTNQRAPAANNTGEPLHFAPVLLALQQRKIDTAKMELQKARGAAPGSEAAQIGLAAGCFIKFYDTVTDKLTKMSDVAQLCNGEYSVVENKYPNKFIIRAAGQSLRFSKEDPISHGQDIFEIMYRHLKMTAVPGNMQYDLGYAAYILFTESADQAPAIKLLNEVQANGSPDDRNVVQALKTLFKIP